MLINFVRPKLDHMSIKYRVYANKPQSTDALKVNITQAIYAVVIENEAAADVWAMSYFIENDMSFQIKKNFC